MIIPKRWEMATLMLSGICVVYTLRVTMSVAAVAIQKEKGWDETKKGYILSAFYWGYTMGQIPASRIAQEFGAKWLFGWSVAIPSILTLLVPLAVHHSIVSVVIVRLLIGICESATFPAVFYFFPIWVPLAEKTFMIPFIVSGMYVGEIIGFSLSGALAESSIYINGQFYGGWQSIFYVFGLIGLAWFPLWYYAAHESPMFTPTSLMRRFYSLIKVIRHYSLVCNCVTWINCMLIGKELPLEELEQEGEVQEEGKEENLEGTRELDTTGTIDVADINMDSAVTEMNISPTDTHIHAPVAGEGNILPLSSITVVRTTTGTGTTNTVTATNTAADPTTPAAPVGYGNTAIYTDSAAPHTVSTNRKDIAHTCPYRAFTKEMFAIKGHHYSHAELTARTPWKQFFTHPTSRALLWCAFSHGWVGFTLLSEMPSFFTEVLSFNIGTAGLLCVFPYAALFLATLAFGQLFDRLQHAHDWSVDTVRKTAMFLSFVCCATALVIAGYLNEQYAAYALIIITQIFYAAAQAGLGCAYTDIAPLYSSSLNSLGNTAGALAGILGPIIVSAFLTTWPGREGWQAAFWLTFAFSGAAMIVWMLFIKAENCTCNE